MSRPFRCMREIPATPDPTGRWGRRAVDGDPLNGGIGLDGRREIGGRTRRSEAWRVGSGVDGAWELGRWRGGSE